ncbi:MAG: acyltransferase [Xanthomonadales bacterium]|nr:acyltransferase [Xanthomonadales bacterium]
MLTKLRYGLQGAIVILIATVSTVVLTTIIFVLSIFKLMAPKGRARNAMTHWLSSLGELWVSINKAAVRFYPLEWDVHIPEGINHKGHYLVFCNHQSGVDILALQHVLNRRAPFGRYLLKHQLIWVPVLGVAWWALDMAFLRRYSRQELIRNPSLRGKDLENAARACEKLKHIPISMMTFPEGTRFSVAKRDKQNSPYEHLLRPRYGGIGQVLYSFDEALDSLIDVTIMYPDGTPSVWHYVSGQVRKISVHIEMRAIDDDLRGTDFREDGLAKGRLKSWLNGIWEEKERLISHTLANDPNLE